MIAGGLGMAAMTTAAQAKAAESKTQPSTPKGRWLIPMEEACVPPRIADEWFRNLAALGVVSPPVMRTILTDFRGQRLEEMDACGIDIQVLAVTIPSPQAEANPENANRLARIANDALAEEVARTPNRFIAFAALSMHDPDVACRELERAVRDLGMRGVLLYNFQCSGEGGGTALFYDDRRYDGFWSTLEQLDVPLYLHPGLIPEAGGRRQDFKGFDWLKEATWEWGVHAGLHALRIMTSGVFDRHPRAQLILGHNGEHIIGDLWRIDNRIKRRPFDYHAGKTVREYFRSNVHITTSGQFSTPGLQHAIQVIGADRIMFAVDYPFEDNAEGTSWFASADIGTADRLAIGRGNAARLLKLA